MATSLAFCFLKFRNTNTMEKYSLLSFHCHDVTALNPIITKTEIWFFFLPINQRCLVAVNIYKNFFKRLKLIFEIMLIFVELFSMIL